MAHPGQMGRIDSDGVAPPAASAPLVLPLAVISRHDLAVAGGKGANLGELVRAGFPVPTGFVVTTAAYDRFVAANHLQESIARALGDAPANVGDGASFRDAFAAAAISPLSLHATLPNQR